MTTQAQRSKLLDLTKEIMQLVVVENALKESEEVIYLTDSDLFPEDRIFSAMIERWEVLSDDVFITEDGQPDPDTISLFKDAGFHVGPGETDAFGWVTGVVSDGRLKFVFG